jgi:uncharacterized protein (DUF3820 family)
MPKDQYKSLRFKYKTAMKGLKSSNYHNPSWAKRDIKETVCWFGLHKGKKFKDIPLEYLVWFTDSSNKSLPFILQLKDYLEETITKMENSMSKS